MLKFWNWFKSFFIKSEPLLVKLAPQAVIIAKEIDPKLTPAIVIAQTVIDEIEASKK